MTLKEILAQRRRESAGVNDITATDFQDNQENGQAELVYALVPSFEPICDEFSEFF